MHVVLEANRFFYLLVDRKLPLFKNLFLFLLFRLLTKLGADLLGSVVHKIHRTLGKIQSQNFLVIYKEI